MANTYCLVNPHIEGEIDTKIKSNNSLKAAKVFYKNLSQHFNNNIPKFYFTVQKGGSGNGKYYHFVVKEVRKYLNLDEEKFRQTINFREKKDYNQIYFSNLKKMEDNYPRILTITL
jgi:hypothetical protein